MKAWVRNVNLMLQTPGSRELEKLFRRIEIS